MPGPHVGIMDWAFGEYRIQLPRCSRRRHMGVSVRESAIAAGPNKVSIATFNVENLDANELTSKFDILAGMIVNNLAAPDIVGLEEIQDNNGATNDSVRRCGRDARETDPGDPGRGRPDVRLPPDQPGR
jgi:predicted extracellular nuclease